MWIIDGWWEGEGGGSCVCCRLLYQGRVGFFFPLLVLRLTCVEGRQRAGLWWVPHVLKLLPDKISSSRLQPEVAMWWHSAAVVSSAERFIRRQSRWSSGDKHHHTLIVEALCPLAAEPNHLFIISYLSFLQVDWLRKRLSDPPKNMCLWTTRTGQFFIFEDTHCFLRFLSPVQMVQILLVEFCEPKPPNVGFRKKKKKKKKTYYIAK